MWRAAGWRPATGDGRRASLVRRDVVITVSDVIALALPSGTSVLAGASGLSREVTWASRLRPNPPAFGHLAGGELVLLPDGVLEQLDERLTLDAAIRQLADFGVAAIAVVGPVTKAARTAADQQGVPLLQLPKRADLGPLERDAARVITERRREVQRRGQEIGRRLTELAIAGEPLVGIVRALAGLSGRAVALEGRDGRLLAYHGQGSGQSGRTREAIAGAVAREHADLARWLRGAAASSPADPPTTTLPFDAGWERVVAPVIGRDGVLGGVSLVVARGTATPEDAQAAARGAAAAAVVLAREYAAANARREVELHVLDELLDGALRSEATLIQQAKRLGHDLRAPHVALVVRLDAATGAGPVRAQRRDDQWSAVGELISRSAAPRGDRALWRVRNNSAEIVWPTAVIGDAARLGQSLREMLAPLAREDGGAAAATLFSVGVGTPRDGIAGIRRSHQEARQAVALGRRLHGPGHLTRFDELGVYRLIFAAEGLPELRGLHDEALGPLLAYDRDSGGDLVRTLDAFFAARCSPKEAAERLHVHRNTVLYRLDRVRALTGCDLDDATTRLRLQLALHAHLALFNAEG